MIHGDNDLIVSYSQSQNMAGVMNNAGYTNKLVTIPAAGHDLGVSNQATANLIVNEIAAWVNIYGK
jgi:alpha-beta hydrolase superfamily lysophospholipase